ncbi:MAG: histidine triad nucleotide-binding protein [Nitrospira sp.]|nr:histidine triad nucleotide-binding protein [Nitrospira sp.]
MSDCLFCKIAEKKIPSKIVHEDDRTVVFEDIHPQAPTHLLIIPKTHLASLSEAKQADRDLLGHLLLLCATIAEARGLTQSGYRVVSNTGAQAGQSVFHLHLHLLGGRPMHWPPG